MGSVFVVVEDVFPHETLQMPFIEHDHMVESVTTAAPHPALRNSVLPRTAKRGAHRFRPQSLGRADHVIPELSIPVKDEELPQKG